MPPGRGTHREPQARPAADADRLDPTRDVDRRGGRAKPARHACPPGRAATAVRGPAIAGPVGHRGARLGDRRASRSSPRPVGHRLSGSAIGLSGLAPRLSGAATAGPASVAARLATAGLGWLSPCPAGYRLAVPARSGIACPPDSRSGPTRHRRPGRAGCRARATVAPVRPSVAVGASGSPLSIRHFGDLSAACRVSCVSRARAVVAGWWAPSEVDETGVGMTLRVAVDFGTSSTCIAISVRGREPQVVAVDGSAAHVLRRLRRAGRDALRRAGGRPAGRRRSLPLRAAPQAPHRRDRAAARRHRRRASATSSGPCLPARSARRAGWPAARPSTSSCSPTPPTGAASAPGCSARRQRARPRGSCSCRSRSPPPSSTPPASPSGRRRRQPGPSPCSISGAARSTSASCVACPATRRRSRSSPPAAIPTFGGADIDQLLLDHVGSLVADHRRRRLARRSSRAASSPTAGVAASSTRTSAAPRRPSPGTPTPTSPCRRPSRTPTSPGSTSSGSITTQLDRAAELTVVRDRRGRAQARRPGRHLPRRRVEPDPAGLPARAQAHRGRADLARPAGDGRGPRRAAGRRPRRRHRGTEHRRVPPTAGRSRAHAAGPADPAASHRHRSAAEADRTALLLTGGRGARRGRRRSCWSSRSTGGDPRAAGAADLARRPAPSRVIAQYEYQFALPEGWLQTGGDPDRLRTELKPAGARGRRRPRPRRAEAAVLRQLHRPRPRGRQAAHRVRAGRRGVRGLRRQATYAGRDVIRYRERLAGASGELVRRVPGPHPGQRRLPGRERRRRSGRGRAPRARPSCAP